MYPYLHTPFGDVSTFQLCVVLGFLVLIFTLHFELKVSNDRDREEVYIFAKVFTSAFVGYAFAGVFDAIFKIRQNGGFKISGVTFYGGLIGAMLCMYILLRLFRKNTQYSVMQWFNLLAVPLVAFHICGRIGCFLGGCCYGKTTDSFLGVSFPSEGVKCYPTQLFEAIALAIILILLLTVFSKDRFRTYLLCYSVCRFFIEFFRGDNRGEGVLGLSPAQSISVLIAVFAAVWLAIDAFKKSKT